ncbi:Unknown protein sequence [Pseudomonas syringae pv. cilantro]|uniref:Uncharacterized protein n=1 Tax=Pseudomonas syringae pv. cilantro TaxID=81035 RepID=A0A0N0X9G7_PSESX|nr:Unknown protein sequence [Pseudomonas syringae pv. cilantro]
MQEKFALKRALDEALIPFSCGCDAQGPHLLVVETLTSFAVLVTPGDQFAV